MKNRASLTLMELLVMVLVFALAAALCLRLFAAAEALSEAVSRQDRAVLLAQNAAEALKAGKIPETTLGELHLTIREMEPEVPGMHQAEMTVYFEEEAIFAMETGWQEVAK